MPMIKLEAFVLVCMRAPLFICTLYLLQVHAIHIPHWYCYHVDRMVEHLHISITPLSESKITTVTAAAAAAAPKETQQIRAILQWFVCVWRVRLVHFKSFPKQNTATSIIIIISAIIQTVYCCCRCYFCCYFVVVAFCRRYSSCCERIAIKDVGDERT